ncbi:trithorax group protein osa [Drosophila madeirensis]|uniref:Trithorax group protein osa n=1 Tax=Drosophila madeirensis TaxID=30013 RepID=A0AAU9GEN1_DROMD
MLQLSVERGLALLPLLMLLGLFASLEAAPSSSTGGSKKSRPEELVRVYSINAEQYARVLQLTQGRNVISEARLINGGFATVGDSLSSGWHSLLRIVGLTTLSKADEDPKVDFDGQPLCVIKTREDAPREEGSPRSSSTNNQDEEESAINCIVVLKKEHDLEQPTPDHYQYLYSVPAPQSAVVPQEAAPQAAVVPPVESAAVGEPAEQVAEQVEEQVDEEITTEAPQRSRSKSKKENTSSESTTDSFEEHFEVPRQYGAGYPPPPPQYGGYSPYGGYPYSPYSPPVQPYGAQPYPPYGQSLSPYAPQQPFGLQQPFGPQQPFGGQPPIGSPYYPQPYYGQPAPNPYAPYSYFEQTQAQNEVEKAEADDEQDEDEDSSEAQDEDVYGYDKKSMIYYKKVYAN